MEQGLEGTARTLQPRSREASSFAGSEPNDPTRADVLGRRIIEEVDQDKKNFSRRDRL